MHFPGTAYVRVITLVELPLCRMIVLSNSRVGVTDSESHRSELREVAQCSVGARGFSSHLRDQGVLDQVGSSVFSGSSMYFRL